MAELILKEVSPLRNFVVIINSIEINNTARCCINHKHVLPELLQYLHFPLHEIQDVKTYFSNQLNAQFLYSITIYILHYNPRHVSRINMPIFRRTNCIITASGIVTLCTVQYNMPDERRLLCSLLSSGILYNRLQRVTIPDAVIIKFVLLKMGMLMLETCRGL